MHLALVAADKETVIMRRKDLVFLAWYSKRAKIHARLAIDFIIGLHLFYSTLRALSIIKDPS